MQKTLTLLLTATVMSLVLTFCSGDSGSSSDNNDNNNDNIDSISLQSELLTPGNSVELATAGGATVSGVTTDTGGDGSADGLDFNGDSSLDAIYLEGTLSKTGARSEDSFAFRLAGSDTVFYFRTNGESIQIFSDEDGTSLEVTIVTAEDGATILGVNTTGGEEADIVLDVPLFVGEEAAVVLTLPPSGATIGSLTEISITFSEAMVESSISLSGSMVTEAGAPNIELNSATNTLSLTPIEVWPAGEQSFTISGTAVSGQDLADKTFTYTVDDLAPTLIGGEPAPAEFTDITGSSVKVKFVFNEAIDPDSVSVNVSGSDYTDFDIATTNTANDTVRVLPPGEGSWGCLYDDPFTVTASDIFGNSNTYGPFLYGGCG